MTKTALFAVLVSLSLFAMVPDAGAQLAGAGLSGQCYNANASEGGEDEARADTSGNVVVLSGTDPTNPTEQPGGAVPAVVLFATESVNDGGQTGNACKRYDCFTASACNGRPERYDYLEVDANAGDVFVQVCYNGGADLSGSCPTSPTGSG